LEHEIASGRFRADLYYRINVFQFRLPKLCERREDIAVLAEYFRGQHEKQFAKESAPLEPQMLNYMQKLDWPGNLRELSNGIARHVLIGAEAKIVQEPVTMHPDPTRGSSRRAGVIPLKRMAKEVVRERVRSLILEALQANQWNRRETAKVLKISYRTLIYKIRESGLT
jgi:two-component system response regulator AtoC